MILRPIFTSLAKPSSFFWGATSPYWNHLKKTSCGRRSLSTNAILPHQLNINKALKKKDEGHYFQDLVSQPVTTLQGIGPKHAEELETLGISTIEKLASYKFFHLARCLCELATVEEEGGRSEESTMNMNKGLDKACENLPLKEIVQQPVHALQGITAAKREIFASLGVKTIEDLANFKYCRWAEAIQTAGKFEERV